MACLQMGCTEDVLKNKAATAEWGVQIERFCGSMRGVPVDRFAARKHAHTSSNSYQFVQTLPRRLKSLAGSTKLHTLACLPA
jgi:hypothetical protein